MIRYQPILQQQQQQQLKVNKSSKFQKMISRDSINSVSGYKSLNKRPYSSVYEDEVDEKELGAETEAEKHLKVLLQKQLNTKISLKDQFAQHRVFSCPSTFNAPTELIKGTCTLDKFKEIEKNEELHQELQRCGLSEEEIADYLLFKSRKKKGNYSVNPDVWSDNIKAIEEKIKTHNEELMKPQGFRNVKKLTRHEMDIEKSLYAGCSEKSKLATLVAVLEENPCTEDDSAFKHIKNLSQKLFKTKKKKRKILEHKPDTSLSKSNESDSEDCNFQYDSNIHHVIIPLEEDEIKGKRLSVLEIKKLPRFENYEIGNPSKTLYLKNLHPKITVHELRSLFGGFEEENKRPIDYKVCSGRMKGQAFIKFSGSEIAEKALKYVNGYSLRGKPIIIEFGHKS